MKRLCVAFIFLLIRADGQGRKLYAGVTRSKAGQLFFRTSDLWGLHGVRSGDPNMKAVSLHHIPEASRSNIQLTDDFAVDDRGFSYVPAPMTPWQPRAASNAVVFVLDPAGGLARTVRLDPDLSVHDASGQPLTEATLPPWTPCFPAFADSAGKVHFMRLTQPGKVELVKTSVSIQ